MKFKIIEYNILDGFHNREAPYAFNAERLATVRSLIKKENPDILVLPEACDEKVTRHGIKIDYAKEFGLPYHFHGHKPNGSHHGISLLSRWPFVEKENYSVKDMKFVRVSIEIGSKIVRVDALHPHPSLNDHQTGQFFKSVLRDLCPYTILTGDFNSWSRTDKPYNRKEIVAKFATFEELKDKDKSFVESIIDDSLTFEAMDIIEKSGLIDTYRAVHPTKKAWTIPTDSYDKDKSAASRLDYIFCSKNFRIVDAGIIKNEFTEKGSDHYPIYALLEIQ